MSALSDEFEALENAVMQLIGLLTEAEERFWIPYLTRGLTQIQENKLAGATFVLGCFGGQDTLSDLVIGAELEQSDPRRFRNQNARLGHLRTAVFEAANAITARRSW